MSVPIHTQSWLDSGQAGLKRIFTEHSMQMSLIAFYQKINQTDRPWLLNMPALWHRICLIAAVGGRRVSTCFVKVTATKREFLPTVCQRKNTRGEAPGQKGPVLRRIHLCPSWKVSINCRRASEHTQETFLPNSQTISAYQMIRRITLNLQGALAVSE